MHRGVWPLYMSSLGHQRPRLEGKAEDRVFQPPLSLLGFSHIQLLPFGGSFFLAVVMVSLKDDIEGGGIKLVTMNGSTSQHHPLPPAPNQSLLFSFSPAIWPKQLRAGSLKAILFLMKAVCNIVDLLTLH